MHGHFFENFIKSWKISLVTYKNMQKVQAVPTRVMIRFIKAVNFISGNNIDAHFLKALTIHTLQGPTLSKNPLF